MKELTVLELSSEQLQQLIHDCARDTDFPKTVAEWNRRIALAEQQTAVHGEVPSRTPFNREEFMGWCAHVGVTPGLDALRAHVRLLRSPEAAEEYGRARKGMPRADDLA
jgi:hypothetical protein